MIVLDSDLLIDLMRRDAATHRLVARWADEDPDLATTSINVAEALRGEAGAARRFAAARHKLRALAEVPFGPRAALRFARLMHGLDRAGSPVPVIDGMIAATTLEAGAVLATRNVRHFDRIPGLELRTG